MSSPTYNFIVPEDRKHPIDALRKGDLNRYADLYAEGEYCWGLQSYYLLMQSGLKLTLSTKPLPEAINLAHGNLWRKMGRNAGVFGVSLQADYPRFPLAQIHLVQNQNQVDDNSFHVPLWPQIGQIPRDPSRKVVETVAYQGRIGFTDLDVGRLNADLNPHGIRFLALDEWRDLNHIDILVGIRNFGKKRYERKPASKLINAWHANIPFIAGWDSAFEQVGNPGRDYLRVDTHEDLVLSILRLKENPKAYGELVAAGAERAREFTTDAIALRWVQVLENHIAPAFDEWKRKPHTARVVYNLKYNCYMLSASLRGLARMCYHIPGIRRMRELYYDPIR